MIDPNNFSPYPKNPIIARFFKEIGWVDELGSGVRNTYKYSKQYSGRESQFVEADVFKSIIPLSPQVSSQVSEKIHALLDSCKTPRSRSEIQQFMGIEDRKYFRIKILNPLIEAGSIQLTISDKPRSSKQKYYSI